MDTQSSVLPDNVGGTETMPAAKKAAKGGGKIGFVPSLVATIAAVVFIVSFFLPYGSANEDHREALQSAPDVWIAESAGISAADAVDLSLFEYAKVYSMEPILASAGYTLIAGIIIAAGVSSILMLLFSLLRKAIPTLVFSLLLVGAIALLNSFFESSSIVPSNTYDAGIASILFIVAGVAVFASSIWMLVAKVKAKKANR